MEKKYYNKYSITGLKFIIEEVKSFYITCPVAIMTTEEGLPECFMKPLTYGQFRVYKYEDNKDADTAYSDIVNLDSLCHADDPRKDDNIKLNTWDAVIRSLIKGQALLALHRFDTKGVDFISTSEAYNNDIETGIHAIFNISKANRQFVITDQSDRNYTLSVNGTVYKFSNLFALFIELSYNYFKAIGSLISGLHIIRFDNIPGKQYLVAKTGKNTYTHICDFICDIEDDMKNIFVKISTESGYCSKTVYNIYSEVYAILRENDSIPFEIKNRDFLEKSVVSKCIIDSLSKIHINKDDNSFIIKDRSSGITIIPIERHISQLASNINIGF